MNLKLYTNIKIYFLYLFFYKDREFLRFLIKNKSFSKSQVYQDLFVLYYSNLKTNGRFIEIGGGNGIDLSNTYLHEKKYNWKGIICEPEKKSQNKIRRWRNAKIEKLPINSICEKNKNFYINSDTYLSSLKQTKNIYKKIKINTLCLNHLIQNKKIGKKIDYISIDTEGNEFEIIKNFNFKKYKVNFFTIEHNFDKKKRNLINKILNKNGYKRVYKYLSYMDDWYMNKKIFKS